MFTHAERFSMAGYRTLRMKLSALAGRVRGVLARMVAGWRRVVGVLRHYLAKPRFIQCRWDHEHMVLGYAAGLVYRTEGILLVRSSNGRWSRPNGVVPVPLRSMPVRMALTGFGLRGMARVEVAAMPLRPVRISPGPYLRPVLAQRAHQRWPGPVERRFMATRRPHAFVGRTLAHDPMLLRQRGYTQAHRTFKTRY